MSLSCSLLMQKKRIGKYIYSCDLSVQKLSVLKGGGVVYNIISMLKQSLTLQLSAEMLKLGSFPPSLLPL